MIEMLKPGDKIPVEIVKDKYFLNSVTFDNLNTSSKEGKLLLAATAILTQSNFVCCGEVIEGSNKTPNEVIEYIKKLAIDIYNGEV